MQNKYEYMNIESYEDFDALYDKIDDVVCVLDDYKYIAIYGKRFIIGQLFKKLICDDYSFGYADYDSMDEEFSDRIYMLFIHANCVVSIEPAYTDSGKIVVHDADSVFVYMDHCKQDIIDYCIDNDMDVTLFDFDVDDCE